MEKVRISCGHKDLSVELEDIFGKTEMVCEDCQTIRGLYQDVWLAMAGNIYSLNRLAEVGYIPGSRPTLKDIDKAGQTLFAQLDNPCREAEAVQLLNL